MLPGLQRLDDFADAVRGGPFDHVGQMEDTSQLGMKSLGGHDIDASGVCPGGHAVRRGDFLAIFIFDHGPILHAAESREPICPSKAAHQGFQRGRRGFFQVQLTGQHFDIFGLDIALGNLQVEVSRLAAN